MTIASNFPAIKPSLMLDFANTKRLDPRVTFTRATTGTYYDGVTTAKAEENLLLQSQDFTTSWTAEDVTITANTEVAPDGTTTADTITENTANTDHRVKSTSISFVSGQSYVISVFAKNGDADFIQIVTPSALGSKYANFDIDTGVVGSYSTDTATITSVGNNWYRLVITATATSTTSVDFSIGLADSSSLGRLTPYTGTSRFAYIWGAQVEQRSSVTSYTATTTQPITNYIPVLLTAASGVPRFDHNPTTDESLGLLIEEQRTNLLTYSAEFDNAAWIKTRANITANTIVAPDGTLTGDKFYDDSTASATHNIGQSTSFTSGTTYTFSIYAKIGERNLFRVVLPSAAFGTAVAYNFDLSAGTTTLVTAGTGNTSSITAVGNGWYRCVVTAQATSTTSGSPALFLVNVNTITYTGDGYSGIFIWGAQLEAGAFPTSYIATTSATVTRNADVASMTGTNFSSWFNNAEGTVYAESTLNGSNTSRELMYINDGTANNNIFLRWSSGALAQASVTVGGVNQVSIAPAGYSTIGVSYKRIFAYKVNDFEQAINGTSVGTDTSGLIPVVSQLNFAATTNINLCGTIKKIAYYPLRLTSAQLQALTS